MKDFTKGTNTMILALHVYYGIQWWKKQGDSFYVQCVYYCTPSSADIKVEPFVQVIGWKTMSWGDIGVMIQVAVNSVGFHSIFFCVFEPKFAVSKKSTICGPWSVTVHMGQCDIHGFLS